MGTARLVGAGMGAVLAMGVWGGPAAAVTGTVATGQIQAVSGSKLLDGDSFMVADGAGSPTVFEFDSNGSVAAGNVAVTFTGALDADGVKAKIATAVNSVGAGLAVTASFIGTGLVGLANDAIGSAGNLPLFEDVADPGFTVTGMSGGDAAPELDPVGPQSVDEGQQLQFTVSATDLDGGGLTYSATNLPAGAAFDSSTRTFTWTPDFGQAGAYPNVHVHVSDGTLSSSMDVSITVNDVNRAPVLAAISDRSVREGELLQFTVSASDPDGDPVVYAAANLPPGASFDTATRTFRWTPSPTQAGTYPHVHFTATDGAHTASGETTISVTNVLQPSTTTLSAKRTSRKVLASGTVQPGEAGQQLDVAVYRSHHGAYRLVSRKTATLVAGSYRAAFKHLAAGRYRVEARFAGSTELLPSSAVARVRV